MHPIYDGFSYTEGNLTMAATLKIEPNLPTLITRPISTFICFIIEWCSDKFSSIARYKYFNLHIQKFIKLYKTLTNLWQTITDHRFVINRRCLNCLGWTIDCSTIGCAQLPFKRLSLRSWLIYNVSLIKIYIICLSCIWYHCAIDCQCRGS